MEARALPSTGQLLAWGLGHLDLIKVVGTAAAALPGATSSVQRWEIIKPAGDKIAPAIDELFQPAATLSATEDELKTQLLAALNTPAEGEVAASKLNFDGKWLDRALTLLPLLLKLIG